MHNDKYQCHILHMPLTKYHLLATKQKPYQNAYPLMKNLKNFLDKSQEKEKIERAIQVDRRTRENIQ